MGFPTLVYNQLFLHPPPPTLSFAHQTVIITGANTGIGLETVRHIPRLGAEKVALAVDIAAGEAARTQIESGTGRPGARAVWHLDLADLRAAEADYTGYSAWFDYPLARYPESNVRFQLETP
ncbi:uncharacterized protein BJX67DRAFT_381860 [Aspergillus lucknowensis]|uniref:Short-chain dehydrogenase n=1 Tax=Aspergillus lucknowensis TaxID=176173 RepID=A0ABR4LQA0_9EURO